MKRGQHPKGTLWIPAEQFDIPGEQWGPVELEPHREHYEVSDHGRVRRSTPTPHGPGGRIKKLSWWGRHPQYLHVLLCSMNVRSFFRVHTLVALTWIGPKPTPEHGVNHKDGDHANNRPENLEWATNAENLRHQHENGLKSPWTPARQPKLKPEQVVEIRRATGTHKEIGERFGVSEQTVRMVKNRYTHKDVA